MSGNQISTRRFASAAKHCVMKTQNAFQDPALQYIADRIGKVRIDIDRGESVWESIGTSILYQQITGKAAASILAKLKRTLDTDDDFPTPQKILDASDATLRSAGLSGNKARALKDLAQKITDKSVPERAEMEKLDDEEIVQKLIPVRGVGRWTAEMFLIFTLGRLDVWPVDDYGVRKGYGLLFMNGEMPTPKELKSFGERFKPKRTPVAWYMWRVLELPEFRTLPKKPGPFDAELDFKKTDFRKQPGLYRVGRGDQGILKVEPYRTELLPDMSKPEKLLQRFVDYQKQRDFVGMDMVRKALQKQSAAKALKKVESDETYSRMRTFWKSRWG